MPLMARASGGASGRRCVSPADRHDAGESFATQRPSRCEGIATSVPFRPGVGPIDQLSRLDRGLAAVTHGYVSSGRSGPFST